MIIQHTKHITDNQHEKNLDFLTYSVDLYIL